MANVPAPKAVQENHHVDYVIRCSFGDTDVSQAVKRFEVLLLELSEVGLQTEVRQGDESSLLIFVRAASKSKLKRAVYQSRVRDWLYGVRSVEPEPASSAMPHSEAERLRVIYRMITASKEEGGAGITPKHGEWQNVDSIFPLHDEETNRQCIRDWSQKTFLSTEDLDQIRNTFGEHVGFYFAFLQSYFRFLIFPAVFGFSCWLLLGSFSIIYTVVNCLWTIVFIEYWKRQENDLSCRWQTKGVSAVQEKRREFAPERQVVDESTGEVCGVFPAMKRMYRQLLQVPFALLAVIALGAIIATCFAIEIFISEVYSGPFKQYLVFIPTVLLSALVPTMSAVLLSVATKLNDYENYETQDAYNAALTQKIFVVNFITSYLPVFLTAFVYVPFASRIVPYLDVFQMTVRPFVSKEHATKLRTNFTIDPDRLRKQVIYFTVTAQIVGFALENIVPFVKQRLCRKYKAYAQKQHAKTETGNGKGSEEKKRISFGDDEEEAKFLTRVRNEAELSEYDVTDDLREMCIQFGYLALFSPVWPLVPVSFLVNNWIELRSDFFKICVECKRPWPQRADTIGPWLDSLGFLSWVGSITSAALVYMFSNGHEGPNGEPAAIKGWALLLTIFFSEHIYLAVRYAVRAAMGKIEGPNERRERTDRFMIRKRYIDSVILAESDSDEPDNVKDVVDSVPPSQITRETLEEEARNWSKQGTDPTERFWMRQRGWKESAEVGLSLITQLKAAESKKQQ
ncbi:anoctamin family protein [Aspergillus clavatus NRRL 1]|uniref:Plasma membrane channel protein Ist2, putative n=1 Tax=Aspergillus clavatus (strain ATCC 1007 / CBS 513.65 / DSM 816 / NCTC 3887 / NRRL 1 / QM 1276 / 107) TaxID=344612 RepID=A1C9M0_ASPCL|nr:plasma membrane channel protein Ist2, putative [Aspergillus clavatus NRRL 1]EAW13544.1 plasma membrane channel protein Ist2, putative [Aspergillus clavatus NRRL 1]